jgi:hypothetical protein
MTSREETDDRRSYQIIADMAATHSPRSDDEVLAELAAIPPLADESDPCWLNEGYWQRLAYPFLALCQVAAERQLRAAVPLILDRACFGDPGEIMRGLCHTLESIVRPEWSALTGPCIVALQSPRPGTRLWAAQELGRLRDPIAIPALKLAAQDDAQEVRDLSASALERI